MARRPWTQGGEEPTTGVEPCPARAAVRIATHASGDAAAFRDRVMAVWATAFDPVRDVEDWRSTIWERHRAREDYRLVTAESDGAVVGFAWGYTGRPGQFWSDFVLRTLGAAAAPWVGGHFEFVELAVEPGSQGRGIGGLLHDAMLEGLPHERALLGTTDDADAPAYRLYRSRGWQVLGSQAPGDVVMGKRLS